nr:hypothetical protein [Alphaproteobacteria bacterium]
CRLTGVKCLAVPPEFSTQQSIAVRREFLQLLTHPIWWAREARATVQDALEEFASDRYRLLRRELGRNCQTFDASQPASEKPSDTQIPNRTTDALVPDR